MAGEICIVDAGGRPGRRRRALLSLERPSLRECVALGSWFSPLLPGAAARVSLDELAAILEEDHPGDFCIAVERDPANRTLTFWRGDPARPVVPQTLVPAGGGCSPDPDRPGVSDHGRTILLGRYESSFGAVLHERDPAYRRRARRRLRKRRGLRQEDFPGVPARTIGRIENGETPRPHAGTLARVAKVLGVGVEEPGEFQVLDAAGLLI